MSKLFKYEDKLVRITDTRGDVFTGVAQTFPSGYGLSELGREEESIRLGQCQLFERDILSIAILPTFEEAVQMIPPGRYRHFKGNLYEVIAIARHSETTQPMVVYRALYGEGGLWVRPADMWNEEITRDGRTVKRFSRVEE